MSTMQANRSTARLRRILATAISGAVLLSLLSLVGGSTPASADYKLSLGDRVAFEDGGPAAHVQIDLFEAINPWTRGGYLGSTSTDGNGHYRFAVNEGCYITVAVAPLGTEFDFLGSGRIYDQTHGCVEVEANNNFDSVLYREDSKPPTTQPPTTHPPTTQPPTTLPPTTQPPTTLPPSPPVSKCRYTHIGVNWTDTFYVDIGGTASLPAETEIIFLNAAGDEIYRSLLGDAKVISGLGWTHRAFPPGTTTRQISLQLPGKKPSTPEQCPITTNWTPIGLDIDGSTAVERISGEFSFDFDADGETEVVAEWFAPTEGILFDARAEGPISGAHLFGDQGGRYADGFEKLARLDINVDGQISDGELDGLAIWTDRNSNAVVDAGEVLSLADHQIVALETSHTNFVSQAQLADGSTMMIEDLWFPAADAGAAPRPIRTGLFGLAGIGILGYAVVAAKRNRDGLDAELADLVKATRIDR